MRKKHQWLYSGKQPGYFLMATILATILSLVLVLTAFWTPSWMESQLDTTPEKVMAFKLPFHKQGLWEICLRVYQPGNPFNRYTVLCESSISLSEDSSFSFPGYIIGCRVLFTLAILLCAAASITLVVVIVCGTHRTLLAVIGTSYILAGVLIALTIIVFAACAFNKNGIFFQEPTTVFLSWSFWIGVAGGVSLFVCGILFLVERVLSAHQSRDHLVTKIIL